MQTENLSIQLLHTMAQYNTWMNQSLLQCGERLSDTERNKDVGAFFGSFHNTMNHILLADTFWLRRLSDDPDAYPLQDDDGNEIQVTGLGQILYPDWGAFKRARIKRDDEIERFAGELTEAWLLDDLVYRNSKGKEFNHPRWWAVQHMFNHQTHHRGQATTILMQLGVDPGVTDLAVMLRDGA